MLFDKSDRVFGLPPGVDFPAELVRGLLERTQGWPPEQVARIRILVNTRRMQRRLRQLFVDGRAQLLPKIGLVTDVRFLAPTLPLPAALPPLRRRLEFVRLLQPLIAREDRLPSSAAVDLAESLAQLLDEMQGEGVPYAALDALDVEGMSEHWEGSLRFLSIIGQYVTATADQGLDPEALRRIAVAVIAEQWSQTPVLDPVIIAGSTGSRATTRDLMLATAKLPQGAVVLPGYDFDLPSSAWGAVTEEDHPQFRFAALLEALDSKPDQVGQWTRADSSPHSALISLSLRPAPVTDCWRTDGPTLGALEPATQGLSLIQAPQQGEEAQAIAVAMRYAVEAGKSVALISPDRALGRRVSTALLRWGIVADDSAGRPLSLSPPGRLFRQVGRMIGQDVHSADLIAALNHPLTATGGDGRRTHTLNSQRLELRLRSDGTAIVTNEALDKAVDVDEDWREWIKAVVALLAEPQPNSFGANLRYHRDITEHLAAGPGAGDSGALWAEAEGRDMLRVLDAAARDGEGEMELSFADYLRLIESLLAQESTRAGEESRPDVMIWGTLEARVQGADLVILGGLNEGTWPERAAPDPWLNRTLRRQLGLLLPEREIGLSAHDYQQAASTPEVILSRAKRDADAETVPARWISRLTNLLSGLPDQAGPEALAAMVARGDTLLSEAAALEAPETVTEPARRPCPAPPVQTRPTKLSVTDIQTLIRDPYAIYARRVLGLNPLGPLTPEPDGRLRGIVFHDIMQTAFGPGRHYTHHETAVRDLIDLGTAKIQESVPWEGIAALWTGRLEAIADHIVGDELSRRKTSTVLGCEVVGSYRVPGTPFTLTGKADRIDQVGTGLVIYDYKTGSAPSQKLIKTFDVQLPLEAVMAEAGAFENIAATPVSYVTHIELGLKPRTQITQLDDPDLSTETISGHLANLWQRHHTPEAGYMSRRASKSDRFPGYYDHLARFGEWDESHDVVPEPIT